MRRWLHIAGGIVAGTFLARGGWGLQPEEVAVVFNTRSAGSLQVARYYLNVRHIPQDHLIPVTCDVGENIAEFQYRTSVVPQLKKALADRKLVPDAKAGIAGIRCLVTTYDVPLRIQARELTAAEKAEVADDEKRLEAVAADLAEYVRKFENLPKSTLPATNATSADHPPAVRSGTASAPATNSLTAPSSTNAAPPKPPWRQMLPKVQDAAQSAAARIEKLGESERLAAWRDFVLLQDHVGGPTLVMTLPAATAEAPTLAAAQRKIQAMAEEVRNGRDLIRTLMPQRDSARMRKEILAQRLRIEGVVGEAAAIEEMIRYVRPEQTAACFDSELALLLADPSYPRGNWLVNPRNLDVFPRTRQALAEANGGGVPPTLMVCRLDGASPAKVEEMIDTGLKVEAKGLKGKMYIDARGLHGTDPYALFDEDLRQTAAWMKAHSTIDTLLEDTPELLQAKNTPEAAVYCGWYSVGNYQESGQWVKGAVGYHVASAEMMSLHNPADRGWVLNLLNRGFCGTLGPTDEPYLSAFPKASQFFPLLLSGEFTQGEVWEVTNPMLSWRLGFVGDPLYNPFKAAPAVKAEDIRKDAVLRVAYQIERGR
jgi:uncharacterized protein (TIGR03790 family)